MAGVHESAFQSFEYSFLLIFFQKVVKAVQYKKKQSIKINHILNFLNILQRITPSICMTCYEDCRKLRKRLYKISGIS